MKTRKLTVRERERKESGMTPRFFVLKQQYGFFF